MLEILRLTKLQPWWTGLCVAITKPSNHPEVCRDARRH
ncbi:unnamed protein product [Brassica oleracea var. botrytis]